MSLLSVILLLMGIYLLIGGDHPIIAILIILISLGIIK